ncbi:MAG: hypothetical protein IE886_05690 [Campylobacterales bacterium]|nr:hypothetical protein [Campylobacterales bacterium]
MRLATLSFFLFLVALPLAAATSEAIIAGAFQTEQDAKQRIEALQWYLQQDPETSSLQAAGAFTYSVRSAVPDYLAVLHHFRTSEERRTVLRTIQKLHPDAFTTNGGEIIAGVFKSKREAQQRNEALQWYLQHNPVTSRLQNENGFAYSVSGGSKNYLAVLEQFRHKRDIQTILGSIQKLHPNAYVENDLNSLKPFVTQPLEPQAHTTIKTPAPEIEAAARAAAAPEPEPEPEPETLPAPLPDSTRTTVIEKDATAPVLPQTPAAKHVPATQEFERTTPFEISDPSKVSDESMLSSVITLLLAELLLGGAALMLFFRQRTH